MKLLGSLAVLVAVSAASATILDFHPLSDERIAVINQKAKTWKAGKNFEIHEWDRVKKIASGVLLSPHSDKVYDTPHNKDEPVPDSFDSREAWPNCETLQVIQDQSACGSCWALSATGAMSDRICIHSNQTKQVYVSAENLLACCFGLDSCGIGCQGGYIPTAWQYWRDTGIVTGGPYNSSKGCQDYSMIPCDHFFDYGPKTNCDDLFYQTPDCSNSCYNSELEYNDSLTYGAKAFTFNNAEQMKQEIYKNGPVEASFLVFEDFVNYKSGVYQATTDDEIGRHATKIIGYGVEDGVPYWLAANTWSSDWGDKGLFKILRGENHCEIESDVATGLPLL